MARAQFARASAFADSRTENALVRMFSRRFAGATRILVLTAPSAGVERVEDFRSGDFLDVVRVGGRRRVERQGRLFMRRF